MRPSSSPAGPLHRAPSSGLPAGHCRHQMDRVAIAERAALTVQFRVPVGFCLDRGAYGELGCARGGDGETLATLRALVDAGHGELERLTGRTGPAVAVRSSAIGEDGAESSFAGQHETVLDVRGVDAIVDAVLACWRSASSERAVAYKKERGITERARGAVLVQELVRADAAAIAFSADPVSGDRDTLVIDACVGL